MFRLVSKNGAVDSFLTGCIDEFFPDEQCVSVPCSQDDFLTWSAEQFWFSTVFVKLTAVMSVKKFSANIVSVFCNPPKRLFI